jgi:thiosulfate/3-mercaptopyruvate sulfurtransferase
MTNYASPEVLVSAEWVAENLGKSGIRVVEVDADRAAHSDARIPGAVSLDWRALPRADDAAGREAFESVMGGAGISPGEIVVLSGDSANCYAAHAFWVMRRFGHRDARLLNGGRRRWLEGGVRPVSSDPVQVSPVPYRIDEAESAPTESVDSSAVQRVEAVRNGALPEWGDASGTRFDVEEVFNADGTFRPAADLEAAFVQAAGLDPRQPTVISGGEDGAGAMAWFVLTCLLGFARVTREDALCRGR